MGYMTGAIFVSSPEQVPTEPHWQVFKGYPASTQYHIECIAFLKIEHLNEYLEKQKPEERRKLRVLKVTPIVIKESFELVE